MNMLVTITVDSGTTAGSFNVYTLHYDEFGLPDPNTYYAVELNVPLEWLLTGRTYYFNDPEERAYAIILVNNADNNMGCVTGQTIHYFSDIELQNNFDTNIGNLQIIAASFGSYTIDTLPYQNDGNPTYYHINSEVPIVDTMSVTIKNNELYGMSYSVTAIDSDSPSPFTITGNTISGETVAISFTGTSLSPNRLFSVTLESLYRPTGLTGYYFCFQYNSDPNTGSTIFRGSLSGACDAMNVIISEERGYSAYYGEAASLSIGEFVYYENTTSLTPFPTGYYLIGPDPFPPSLPDTVIYINNGIIDSFPSCDEVTIGPLSIDDGACESRYNYTLSLTKNTPGYADYYVDWILRSGVTILVSGSSYLTLYEGLNEFTPGNGGCPGVAYGCFYPVNEYNDLTYSAHVRDMSADPTISNVFSSVGMTMGSINTIPTLTQGNSFGSDVSISLTANAHCWFYFTWYVRNSSHGYVSSGTNYIELFAGTSDYFVSGTVPADPGTNHDIQVRLDDAVPHIRTSNHFTIV